MLEKMKIGVAITGSFCSLGKLFVVLDELSEKNADIYLVLTKEVQIMDTRFYKHEKLLEDLKKYTIHPLITDITEAELLGPKIKLDALLIMPATSNTISKLSLGICDNPVLMAAKATLRNQKPVIIAMYTNDALGNSGKSWISLYNTKNVYFVPIGQDDYIHKPNSLVANHHLVLPTLLEALNHKQIQPVLIYYE